MALRAGITVKENKKLNWLSYKRLNTVKNKNFSKINGHSPVIIIISRKESAIQYAKEQIDFCYDGSVWCLLLMCSSRSVLMGYFAVEFIYENEFSPNIISYFEKKKKKNKTKTIFTNLGCPSLFARLAKLYFLPFLSLQEHQNNPASLEKGKQCWSIVCFKSWFTWIGTKQKGQAYKTSDPTGQRHSFENAGGGEK